MGFIINCYKFPIKDIQHFSKMSSDEFNALAESGNLPEDTYEEVLSNFTNWIYFDNFPHGNEEIVWTNLFKIFPDAFYKTITKQQFKNIIYVVCDQVRKNMKSLEIETSDFKVFDNFRTQPVDMTSLEKKYPACIGYSSKDLNLIEKMCQNAFDTNRKSFLFDAFYDKESLDKLLDNKWNVNAIDSYEFILADLIHIYKVFDWDNDVLLAVGN